MGYVSDILIAIPMGVVIYMLVEKLIAGMTADSQFNDKVQKSFVLGFLIGQIMIGLGMTVFADSSDMANRSMRMAMYGAGALWI